MTNEKFEMLSEEKQDEIIARDCTVIREELTTAEEDISKQLEELEYNINNSFFSDSNMEEDFKEIAKEIRSLFNQKITDMYLRIKNLEYFDLDRI